MVKFDKDKYLKKLRFKKYKRYLYIGIPCILVLLIGIYFAYSKFSVSKEEEVVRTTVGEFIHGDVVIGAYIDGEYSKSIPGKNDGYVVEKIVCDNDATGSWNNDSWGIVLTNLSKRTKCNVYFKKNPVSNIIAQLDTSGKCPTMNADGSVNVTEIEATNGYLCKAKDAYGDSYYYRGNVTNNYVEFAGFYWRIVRINGDGTVRVIYDGTSAHANGEASADRQIGKSAFNSSYMDNAYVGYMYGNSDAVVESSEYDSSNNFTNTDTFYISKEYTFDENTKLFTLKNPIQVLGSNLTTDYIGYYYASGYPTSVHSSVDRLYKIMGVTAGSSYAKIKCGYVTYGTSSKEVAQTNTNNSTIKIYLDNWYKTNIVGTTNEQYLADNVFCNDRSMAGNNSGTGSGVSRTLYRWHSLPWWIGGYNSSMRLICPQKNDAFTVSDTTNGNGALTYPVGLLSADEIVLAGGWGDENSGYYLYSGQWWFASSPIRFLDVDNRGALERGVYSNGSAGDYYGDVEYKAGVRPVFNLKAEVLTQGSGTVSDPYRISS
mgnify:CR=1 FL=1